MHKQYFVYIETNYTNTVLYTGVTNNLIKRNFQHMSGIGSGFTTKYKVSKLVYYEIHQDVMEAIKREKQIKNLVRRKKIVLITSVNPYWKDLFTELVST